MSRLWSAILEAYRRWRFVEELAAPVAAGAASAPGNDEAARLRRAIGHEEERLAHYRRYDCGALARASEDSLRAMHRRLHALDMLK